MLSPKLLRPDEIGTKKLKKDGKWKCHSVSLLVPQEVRLAIRIKIGSNESRDKRSNTILLSVMKLSVICSVSIQFGVLRDRMRITLYANEPIICLLITNEGILR